MACPDLESLGQDVGMTDGVSEEGDVGAGVNTLGCNT
jgi:hypothetical protein